MTGCPPSSSPWPSPTWRRARSPSGYGFQGMCTCPVTACAGGTNAVGDAFRHIRDGYAEVMLCGGAEAAITPLAMGGFTSMKALTTAEDPKRASIPFDAERSGFVMGEGAGVLVLEELEHAKARGRQDLRRGGGLRRHLRRLPHHRPRSRTAAGGGRRPWPWPWPTAGVAPEQVGYINAHGTSTPMNDACETAAVKTGVRRPRRQAGRQLHQVHDRPPAGGRRRRWRPSSPPWPCGTASCPPPSTTRCPDPACDLDIVPNAGPRGGHPVRPVQLSGLRRPQRQPVC